MVAQQHARRPRLFPVRVSAGGGGGQRLLETLGGLAALCRLAAACGFRFRGRYWRWRLETAFGSDPADWPPRRERLGAILDYGRWVYRMRRRRRKRCVGLSADSNE